MLSEREERIRLNKELEQQVQKSNELKISVRPDGHQTGFHEWQTVGLSIIDSS